MFKIELNYYIGEDKEHFIEFKEDAVRELWLRYLTEELRKKRKNFVELKDAYEAAGKAFDRFISMIKASTIER